MLGNCTSAWQISRLPQGVAPTSTLPTSLSEISDPVPWERTPSSQPVAQALALSSRKPHVARSDDTQFQVGFIPTAVHPADRTQFSMVVPSPPLSLARPLVGRTLDTRRCRPIPQPDETCLLDIACPPPLTPSEVDGVVDVVRPSRPRHSSEVPPSDTLRQTSLTQPAHGGGSDTLRQSSLTRPLLDKRRQTSLTQPALGGGSDTLRQSSLIRPMLDQRRQTCPTQPAHSGGSDTLRQSSLIRPSDSKKPPPARRGPGVHTCKPSVSTQLLNHVSSPTQQTPALAGPRRSDGSAPRPPNGDGRARQEQDEKIALWHTQKARLGTPDLKHAELESILYGLASMHELDART